MRSELTRLQAVRSVLLCAGVLLCGLQKSSGGEPAGRDKSEANASRTGSLSGRVLFAGEPPTMSPLFEKGAAVKEAEVCSAADMPDESLLVSTDGGIANVFIYLSNAPRRAGRQLPPSNSVTFDVEHCRFSPRGMIVRVGQTVKVRNNDRANHAVGIHAKRNKASSMILRGGTRKTQEFAYTTAESEPVKVTCSFHRWMTAWHLPLNHSFAAVTGEDGRFTIDGLPDGTHRFVVWHETVDGHFLNRNLSVEITAGETTRVELKYDGDRFGKQAAAVAEPQITEASLDDWPAATNSEHRHAESFREQLATAVDASATTLRDGVLFLTNSDAPVEGWVKNVEKTEEGSDQVTILKRFRRGKQNGPTTLWYREQETGRKGFVLDGQQFGTHTEWYSNKQKKSEVSFLLWKISPVTNQGPGIADIKSWYENGQKKSEFIWQRDEHGFLTGCTRTTTWFENGQIQVHSFGQLTADDLLTARRIQLEQTRVTRWYENGNKESEATRKNGNLEGKYTEWHENGQKSYEATFKNGEVVGPELEWDENGSPL